METVMIVRLVLLSFSLGFVCAGAILVVLFNKNNDWEYAWKILEEAVLCIVISGFLNIANACVGFLLDCTK